MTYAFKRREDIFRCFGNFEDALTENELWALSERIKPRQKTSNAGSSSNAPSSSQQQQQFLSVEPDADGKGYQGT